jgi:NAD-dependent dihydropyrimidine dehydrogenase PreA subunit
VAVDVARSALRRQQEQVSASPGMPDRLNESELQIAMNELMDVTRSALRLGALEVHLVCLESREEMPAFEDEVEEAMLEGIKIHASLGPRRFVEQNGKVVGLETIRCKSVFDAQRRFNPVFEPGSEEVIPCDTVILAIGQAADLSFLKTGDGVEVTRQGIVKINPDTMMTTAPGIFAAGDIAFGPRLIINATADGTKAAMQIDRYLQGPAWKPKEYKVQITILDHHEMAANYDEYSRLAVPTLSLDRRTGITEVETGYTEAQAKREAVRCLQCFINTIFEGNETEGTECILCGGCVDVCPENCLRLVPLSQLGVSAEVQDRLTAQASFHDGMLQGLGPSELSVEEGAVMMKDETICIRCGLCAERCPAHTITMEAFEILK